MTSARCADSESDLSLLNLRVGIRTVSESKMSAASYGPTNPPPVAEPQPSQRARAAGRAHTRLHRAHAMREDGR